MSDRNTQYALDTLVALQRMCDADDRRPGSMPYRLAAKTTVAEAESMCQEIEDLGYSY